MTAMTASELMSLDDTSSPTAQDYMLIEAKMSSSLSLPIKNTAEFKAQYQQQWGAHIQSPSTVQPLNPAHPAILDHPFTAQLSWPTRRIDVKTGLSAGYSYSYTASKPYYEYKTYISSIARLTTISDMHKVAGLDARARVGPLDYNGLTTITSSASTDGVESSFQTFITRYYISRGKPKLVVTCSVACNDAATASLCAFDNICAAIDARAALMKTMSWGVYFSNLGFPYGNGAVNHRTRVNPCNPAAMDVHLAPILYRDWKKKDGNTTARLRHLQLEPPSWAMHEYRIDGTGGITFLGLTSKSEPIVCAQRGDGCAASWDRPRSEKCASNVD